jgi:hypothetical protein
MRMIAVRLPFPISPSFWLRLIVRESFMDPSWASPVAMQSSVPRPAFSPASPARRDHTNAQIAGELDLGVTSIEMCKSHARVPCPTITAGRGREQ